MTTDIFLLAHSVKLLPTSAGSAEMASNFIPLITFSCNHWYFPLQLVVRDGIGLLLSHSGLYTIYFPLQLVVLVASGYSSYHIQLLIRICSRFRAEMSIGVMYHIQFITQYFTSSRSSAVGDSSALPAARPLKLTLLGISVTFACAL
ncbi:hypothetical protein RRG08_006853 [Elysia crispata]|uniref:Uncharacterized protein n=1 Tax=Elysia crispata TaxID=231223 RepID=A0AAE0XVP9_9GAST|nr:hypothetical protein RRG08_006853 [Elysia crispata]